MAQGLPEPYYWIDIFAVQQHSGSGDAPQWQPSRSSTARSLDEARDDLMGDDLTQDKGFKAVISSTKRTVVFLQPWCVPPARIDRPLRTTHTRRRSYYAIDGGGAGDRLNNTAQCRCLYRYSPEAISRVWWCVQPAGHIGVAER